MFDRKSYKFRRIAKNTEAEIDFIPDFRRQCARLYGDTNHEPSQTWIKIIKIEKLGEPLLLSQFRKLSDNSVVRSVRSGFIYIKRFNEKY